MANLKHWPLTGEGRELKAASERSLKVLSGLSDKPVADAFALLSQIIADLLSAASSPFFEERIASRKIKEGPRKGGDLGPSLRTYIVGAQDFIDKVTPHLPERAVPSLDEFPTTNAFEPELRSLAGLTFDQRPGPLQYQVTNGILKVRSQRSSHPRNSKSTEEAREHLVEEADKVLVALRQSNVDQRSLAIVDDMRTHLVSKSDIVRIGIANIALEGVLESLHEAASGPVSARIHSFYVGVKLYLGQFDEWHSFVDNVVDTDVTPEATRDAKSVAQDLARQLRANPGLADPDVPLSIELLLEAFRSPRTSAKRLTFALVRSIENICASIFADALEIKKKAVEGAASGTKRSVGLIVGAGLLTIGVTAATAISPTAAKVMDTNWLQSAAKSLMKEIGPSE